MKYIVAGPSIINDIVFADGRVRKGEIGGSVFCVAGIKLWEDDCLFVSNVGPDFRRYYGKWMDQNACSYDGLRCILPHTQYTTLVYDETGLHSERTVYDEQTGREIDALDVLTAAQLAAHCDRQTKGIYIEAGETSDIWAQLPLIREKCAAKIMWELPTSAAMQPERRPRVLETLQKTDIYSINLPEALCLFNQPDESSAIRAILELDVPCFFRVGKKGAYLLNEGRSFFAPSVTLGAPVDATGCGNCSTAAALYGWCEGFDPVQTVCMANISAAYNLLQYGPYPRITEKTRENAHALLSRQLRALAR